MFTLSPSVIMKLNNLFVTKIWVMLALLVEQSNMFFTTLN